MQFIKWSSSKSLHQFYRPNKIYHYILAAIIFISYNVRIWWERNVENLIPWEGKWEWREKNYTEVEIKIALGKKVYMLPTHILEEIGEKNNVGGRVRGIWEIEEGGRIFINIVNISTSFQEFRKWAGTLSIKMYIMECLYVGRYLFNYR